MGAYLNCIRWLVNKTGIGQFMKYLILLLLSFNVHAEYFIVGEKWGIATERMDGSPLLLADISKHTMYRVSCGTGKRTGEIIRDNIQNDLTVSYWMSPTPIDCFIMTTTDTDGHVSDDSEVFHAVAYDAPKPVECVK